MEKAGSFSFSQFKDKNLDADVVNLFSTPLESYKAPDNQIVEWHSKASDINQDSDEEMTDKKNEKPKHYLPPEIKDQQAERTLFLGNLPFEMTTKELKKLVKPYGTIEALRFRSVPFKESFVPKQTNAKKYTQCDENRKTKNAYVVFTTPESCQEACKKIHNVVHSGFHIHADLVHAEKKKSKFCVFVGNLPYVIEEEELRTHFSTVGEIDYVRIIRDQDGIRSKGFAYVNFCDVEAMHRAIQLNEKTELSGKTLRVFRAKDQQKQGDQGRRYQEQAPVKSRNNTGQNSRAGANNAPVKERIAEKKASRRELRAAQFGKPYGEGAEKYDPTKRSKKRSRPETEEKPQKKAPSLEQKFKKYGKTANAKRQKTTK